MRRLFTIIFSVMLAMTALAQRDLGLDEITKPIGGYSNSIGGYNWKRKIHEKGIHVIFRHTILLERSFRNMKGITDFVNSRSAQSKETLDIDTLKAKIDHEEMVYKEICARVRQMFDSLMEASGESHHFESHKQNIDTINYSICLESNKSRKLSEDDWEFPDTTETLTLSMRSKETEIGKRIYFRILHERIEYADQSKEKSFDIEAYNNAILPVLNQEGVKSWDYNWQIDNKKHIPTEKEWSGLNGEEKASGTRNGKIFFIPKKDEVLAQKIMDEVNKATTDYLTHNGDQLYNFNYKVYDEAKQRHQKGRQTLFLPILGGAFFSITEEGYYITISNKYSNLQGYPKEWYKLKSYINGKKEYIKGAKK